MFKHIQLHIPWTQKAGIILQVSLDEIDHSQPKKTAVTDNPSSEIFVHQTMVQKRVNSCDLIHIQLAT